MPFNMARRRPAPPHAPPEKSILGTEIESKCRKCKKMTQHVVLAKVGSKPTRVRCTACETEHEHTVSRPRRVADAVARQLPWAEALAEARGVAVPYTSAATYRVGARVSHPSFGEGVVVRQASPTVCEVLFESRPVKLLMAATPSGFAAPPAPSTAALRRKRRFG